tara:strand:+ start:1303 stop:1521 length:219 start_codon:yes stop_codon:yes gene_type:complete
MSSQQDLYSMMVKLDERQKTIFNMLARVEKHLEKLNGQVAVHETNIAQMKVYGSVAIFSLPIIINVIMRLLP